MNSTLQFSAAFNQIRMYGNEPVFMVFTIPYNNAAAFEINVS